MMRTLLFLVVLVLSAAPAAAADLCVKAGGSDATAKGSIAYVAGNEAGSTCWATLGRAAWGSTTRSVPNATQAAAAGDTVYIFGGTYASAVSAAGDEFDVLYNPTNNGTSGKPIVFRALATVTLTTSAWVGPVVGGSVGRTYIHWVGPFMLNEKNLSLQAETGSVVLFDCDRCLVDGLTIVGIAQAWGTNHNGIRLEDTDFSTIRNVTISGIRLSPDGHNAAGIMMYDSNDNVLEYVTVSNCGAGIYEKGAHAPTTQARNVFRFNVLHGNGDGIVITASDDSKYYQNIIRDNVQAAFKPHSLGGGPNRTIIANNVMTGNDIGILYGGSSQGYSSMRVFNNIFYANRLGMGSTAFGTPGSTTHEHNVYHRQTEPGGDIAHFLANEYTLPQWQRLGQDSAAPASTSASPLFTKPAADDYTISGPSSARNLGVDIADLDADGSTSECAHAGAHQTNSEVFGAGGRGGGSAGSCSGGGRAGGANRLRRRDPAVSLASGRPMRSPATSRGTAVNASTIRRRCGWMAGMSLRSCGVPQHGSDR